MRWNFMFGMEQSINFKLNTQLQTGEPPKRYINRCRNSEHALITSVAFRIADTTQMRFAPAAKTSSSLRKLMPPMANHGMFTPLCGAAAQRTYSSVTGFAIGFVPVE